jgi:nucleoside-diphosphate-sugar epimerase
VKSGLDTLAPQLMRRKALGDVRAKRWGCAVNPRACVLLTGDLGKLGRYIARATEHDYGLVGFDYQYHPREDLANYDALKEKMANCQYVVHGAAIPHPNQGTIEDYVKVNVVGTLNVLKAAHETGVKRVIYLSSTAYYGCNIRGRLLPAYFPIDEQHPIAATSGRGEGGLDEYNQSKVMAEQLLAFFGTNRICETIALRLGPSNSKADSYDESFDWRTCDDYRRGCFFANCHPEGAAQAVRAALDSTREFWYEAFNIVDRYTHESVDVALFLKTEYPDVEVRAPITPHMGLVDVSKAVRELGYRPVEDLR